MTTARPHRVQDCHSPPVADLEQKNDRLLNISYVDLAEEKISNDIPLYNFEAEFKAACEAKDELRKAALEECILKYLTPPTPVIPEPTPTPPTFWNYIRPLIFGVLFIGGTVNGMVSTYVSVQHLMAQISTLLHLAVAAQAIFNVVATVTACVFAVINFVLFTQFEVQLLKSNLGLHSQKEIEPTLAAHRKQIKVTKMINRYLSQRTYEERSQKPLDTVTHLAALFSEDVRNKAVIFKESNTKKWLNRIATTLGFIMQGAIVFFGWSVMVAGGTSAAALAAVTPLGWALILFNVSVLLGFYISKRRASPNKQLDEFKKIGGKQTTFVAEHNAYLSLFNEQKNTDHLRKEIDHKQKNIDAFRKYSFLQNQGILEKHLQERIKKRECQEPSNHPFVATTTRLTSILKDSLKRQTDTDDLPFPRSPSLSRSSSEEKFSPDSTTSVLGIPKASTNLRHGIGFDFPQRPPTPPIRDMENNASAAEVHHVPCALRGTRVG